MSLGPDDEVEFADGFDVPDRLAFGLGAAQLAAVAVGVVAGYVVAHSPLPGWVAVPLGAVVAAIGAVLGWLRPAGRPAVDWAVDAARFLLRPRRGTMGFSQAGGGVPAAARTESAMPPEPPVPLRPYVVREEPAAAPAPTRPAQRLRVRRGGAHRITFFSLKGGTGRTTLAAELAVQLAATGRRGAGPVALLDLDLRAPSVGARVGLQGGGLLDFATAPPDERRAADNLVCHRSRLRVLLGADRPVRPEWPVTAPVVRELLRDLDMEGFAVVVIDVAPELSPLNQTVLVSVDDVFVVLTPTASGIHDAYRTTEALRRQGLRHQLRYVVNRSRSGTDVAEAMRDLDGQVVAEIPEDPAVTDAENAHLPASAGTGAAAHALQRFARRLESEISWSCED